MARLTLALLFKQMILPLTVIFSGLMLVFTTNAFASTKAPIRIAVAANFAPSLEFMLPELQQKTGRNIQLITGSTGSLFQQIVHGAPFDLFLAADSIRPGKLVELNLAEKQSQQTYAIGQLAFWSASWKEQGQSPSLEQLLAQFKHSQAMRLAIANPELAPYGKGAKEALVNFKLWSILRPRLITGINVGQTFQQLRSQAVPLGIVATSQLAHNQLSGVVIPSSLYQPIKQQLVILKSSKHQAVTQQVVDYLLSDKVQGQLVTLGYRPIADKNIAAN